MLIWKDLKPAQAVKEERANVSFIPKGAELIQPVRTALSIENDWQEMRKRPGKNDIETTALPLLLFQRQKSAKKTC